MNKLCSDCERIKEVAEWLGLGDEGTKRGIERYRRELKEKEKEKEKKEKSDAV